MEEFVKTGSEIAGEKQSRQLNSRVMLLFVALLAYIGVSGILYVQEFGLTEQQFSFYFAANAIVSIVGSFFYIFLARFIRPIAIITGSLGLYLISLE